MPRNPFWSGVFPAVTTQFNADNSLNLPATQQSIERLLRAGVHGLIMLGTCGENCSLLPEEKRAVLAAAKEVAGAKVPIISGVSEYTTALASQYAKDAQKIGIDGLMVLPGMVYKSDTRETLTHFRTVARASDLPIMIYNNPIVYGVDIKPETFGELAGEKTIVAIKESSDDPRRITDLHNLHGDRFTLFCGVDDLVLESAALGIDGWVSGLTDVFPEESVVLWDLLQAGRFAEARGLYRWFTPLLHLDTKIKLVQYIKIGQQVVGLGSEKVRPPRLELDGAERAEIIAMYETALKNRPQLGKLNAAQ
ncbi:dihydrodipicolinate synthase family protein [Dongia soli]|uniref:Dihydrodipicolinate synthase family protein n=1 Tax=Dongia soli TaxID=600628 RepID=A0ABU5E967_9PROT|nr:dihydrodipicolinate synthase family protein [Dongia soli]MDY0882396.1 dihydrodipicolinate synthase family protein [Dongia soli]